MVMSMFLPSKTSLLRKKRLMRKTAKRLNQMMKKRKKRKNPRVVMSVTE
jgi:hypothetical protein